MQDPAAGSHPLDIAGSQRPLVAEAVAVFDTAGQDIGNGFDAAVRVPGKACAVIAGIVTAEIVEEQEGIKFLETL